MASRYLRYQLQFPWFNFRVKLNASLFQYPRLDLFMMHAQQVQRTTNVILFSNTLRSMALYLRTDATGNIKPIAKAGKRTAQSAGVPAGGSHRGRRRSGYAQQGT